MKSKSLAVLTPINTPGGIEIYSKDLYFTIRNQFSAFYYLANKDITSLTAEDDSSVVRTWQTGESDFSETINFIKQRKIDIVHIQYHSRFYFSIQTLDNLIRTLKDLGIKVFVTLHAVRSTSFNFISESQNLQLADKVMIHNKKDFEYAKQKLSNVILFTHPTEEYSIRSKSKLQKELGIDKYTPIIASHGLMNSNKNIPEIIKAIAEVRKTYSNVLFISLNAVSLDNLPSSSEFEKCKQLIRDLNLEKNVILIPSFLDLEQVVILLQASDMIVYNYSEVGESASAAVNKALGSLTPAIVTDIKMFDELQGEVLKIANTSSSTVSEAIILLASDLDLQNKLKSLAKQFVVKNSFEAKALELLKIYSIA